MLDVSPESVCPLGRHPDHGRQSSGTALLPILGPHRHSVVVCG